MKRKLCMYLATVAGAAAQVVPPTPTAFTKRPIGAATESVGVKAPDSKPAPEVWTISYYSLTPLRQFTSSDGKSILAKLIAWEELRVQGTTTAAPALPSTPTVIKGGKIRVLVGQQPREIPLEKLSAADQAFIKNHPATKAAAP
jgi:hypothetical protein